MSGYLSEMVKADCTFSNVWICKKINNYLLHIKAWLELCQDHGHLQKQENILEDELLVNVPGSAYSGEKGTITGNEVLEESKSQ